MTQKTEMPPPWEVFPTLERTSIGWRMGSGESYIHEWWDWIESLPEDESTRIAYLRRYRPAPMSWLRSILTVLQPSRTPSWYDEDDDDAGMGGFLKAEAHRLERLGLIAYDAAYNTWLAQQTQVAWPWAWQDDEAATPEEMVRYATREMWFFSRQLRALREEGKLHRVSVPLSWGELEMPLWTGSAGALDASQGLLALAKMFCAGEVLPPWSLGLSLDDFADSFEMEMGYADAYRLWLISAFDDERWLEQQHLAAYPIPAAWAAWIEDYLASLRTR